MGNERPALGLAIPNIDLHASRVTDAAVQEANAFQHRRYEPELVLKSAVHEFLARVPMGEVAIEADFGIPVHELAGSPDVLEDRRAMRLHIEREAMLLRRLQDRLDQRPGRSVVLHAPAHVQRAAYEARSGHSRGDRIGLLRQIDPAASSDLKS